MTSRHKLISLPKWLRDDSKFEMGDRKCPLDFNLWPPDPIDNIHTLHKIHIFIFILKIMNAHCKSMNLVFLLKRKTQLKNVFFFIGKREIAFCIIIGFFKHPNLWPPSPLTSRKGHFLSPILNFVIPPRLFKSFEFGNGSRMSDENLVILEFKYL